MPEPVAPPGAGDHALRGQVLQVRGGDLVQPLSRRGELPRGRHLVAESPDDGHPLIRQRRGLRCDAPPLPGPVPVEERRRGDERRRARRFGAAFEKEMQVLGKPQDLQLPFSERRRIETGLGQDLLDLGAVELGYLDPRVCSGHQPPQAWIVPPVEGAADDDGVDRGPWADALCFMEHPFDEVARTGTAAGRGGSRVHLVDDEDAGPPGRAGSLREHQNRRLLEIEAASEVRGGG